MISSFIARKYLASRFITFASFLLVSVSVAILIILLAVMEGFKTEMIERIRGTSADLKVQSTGFVGMDEHERVRVTIEGLPGLRALVPYVDTNVMYRLILPPPIDDRSGHLTLQVMDLRREAEVGKLEEYLRTASDEEISARPRTVAETLSREWVERGLWRAVRRNPPDDIAELRPILLGREVFPSLWFPDLTGLQLELTTISPVTSLPRGQRFVIAGYFRSRDVQHDTHSALMDLEDAIGFLALENRETGRTSLSGFRVFLDDGVAADDFKARARSAIEAADIPFVEARTWREEKQKILSAVEMEKSLVGIILGVIIIFVGLMIFIIMTVQIVEKTRDIGILRAVGATRGGVVGIYLRMGAAICLAGIALGALYGVAFCLNIDVIQRWLFALTGREIFPRHVYYIDQIPVRLVLSDFLFIIVPTVAFAFLASLLAALRAARTDPLDALRYE